MGSTARKIFVETERSEKSDYVFSYDADAQVLEASITQPVIPKPPAQAPLVTLAPDGAYQNVPAGPFQLGNILSYTGGYSQVSGFQNSDGNYVTLATAVIEGLNILETLTADRVVAQITTVMTPGNPVQSVSFAGSRICNLQILGHAVPVSVNQNALGPQPPDNGSYFDPSNLPAGMTVTGDELSGTILTPTTIPQLVVPNFGTVSLGQLMVTRTIPEDQTEYVYDYKVVMIQVDLSGGGAEGCVTVVMADPNGGGRG
jgi:hypothetical protein